MKTFFFSVRDSKVGAFMPVFQARSRGEAVRSFMDAIATPDHQFAKHASDYELFQVGEFDDENGVLVAGLEAVISGLACMPKSD